MSAWPSPSNSKFSSASIAAQEREKQRAARQKKRLETESASLAAGRFHVPLQQQTSHEKNQRQLSDFIDHLRGPAFRSWFEATTGEAADEWLNEVCLTPQQYLERSRTSTWPYRPQIDWIREKIEFIANRHPWTNPDRRKHWAEVVANCQNPRERRRILIRLATPRWADFDAMTEIYARRAAIERETGIPHDVDHIVPIVNQLVCGLHWEGNLRIIPASENRKKSNFFDPNA
jgi:hypothetical protein